MSAALGSAAAFAPQNTQNAQPNQARNAYADLNSGEFLEIILSELTNQDPLAPNDTGAILEQLSSLRNIESQATLETKFEALVTQNAISTSANMIGKFVEGLNAANNTVAGVVSSLVIEEGKPVLRLSDGSSLDADRVLQVRDAEGDANSIGGLLGGIDPESVLGMMVAGVDSAGETVTGLATGIRFEGGLPFFELDTGRAMPFDGLRAIRPLDESSAS
ncbi:MAG: flagellar hook capping FlgD N-terminal domain-containing protein [Planctomycetota bacterium]